MNYLEAVKKFHEAMKLKVGKFPKLISQKEYSNRMRLILEELSEYSQAIASEDIVEIADALGDLLYVVFGTCVEHGLPMDKIFKEIHESNMTKADGHLDRSGKWIKPDNYKKVDLTWLIS